MNKKGILIVVSGFAGTGKGTVIKELMLNHNNYALSVSATTRNPRPGEVEGVSYFFKTEEEFEKLIEKEELLEHAYYVNHYYGTPKDYVEKMLEQGKDVILEIEIQGALKIIEKYKHTVSVFLLPPSGTELKSRLIKRATEKSEEINARLRRSKEETEVLDKYDYLLVNENIQQCAKEFDEIVRSEHKKSFRNAELINKIKEELENF